MKNYNLLEGNLVLKNLYKFFINCLGRNIVSHNPLKYDLKDEEVKMYNIIEDQDELWLSRGKEDLYLENIQEDWEVYKKENKDYIDKNKCNRDSFKTTINNLGKVHNSETLFFGTDNKGKEINNDSIIGKYYNIFPDSKEIIDDLKSLLLEILNYNKEYLKMHFKVFKGECHEAEEIPIDFVTNFLDIIIYSKYNGENDTYSSIITDAINNEKENNNNSTKIAVLRKNKKNINENIEPKYYSIINTYNAINDTKIKNRFLIHYIFNNMIKALETVYKLNKKTLKDIKNLKQKPSIDSCKKTYKYLNDFFSIYEKIMINECSKNEILEINKNIDLPYRNFWENWLLGLYTLKQNKKDIKNEKDYDKKSIIKYYSKAFEYIDCVGCIVNPNNIIPLADRFIEEILAISFIFEVKTPDNIVKSYMVDSYTIFSPKGKIIYDYGYQIGIFSDIKALNGPIYHYRYRNFNKTFGENLKDPSNGGITIVNTKENSNIYSLRSKEYNDLKYSFNKLENKKITEASFKKSVNKLIATGTTYQTALTIALSNEGYLTGVPTTYFKLENERRKLEKKEITNTTKKRLEEISQSMNKYERDYKYKWAKEILNDYSNHVDINKPGTNKDTALKSALTSYIRENKIGKEILRPIILKLINEVDQKNLLYKTNREKYISTLQQAIHTFEPEFVEKILNRLNDKIDVDKYIIGLDNQNALKYTATLLNPILEFGNYDESQHINMKNFQKKGITDITRIENSKNMYYSENFQNFKKKIGLKLYSIIFNIDGYFKDYLKIIDLLQEQSNIYKDEMKASEAYKLKPIIQELLDEKGEELKIIDIINKKEKI